LKVVNCVFQHELVKEMLNPIGCFSFFEFVCVCSNHIDRPQEKTNKPKKRESLLDF
jgi:hypothetical protein